MLKDLPPTNNSMFLGRVREILQTLLGRSGDRRDQLVTIRDLDEAGIASPNPGFLTSGTGTVLSDPTPDMTVPPSPTGFTATSGTTNILFQTDAATFSVGHGYARTVIYAANYSGSGPLPTFSDAVEYYTFRGPIAAAPFDPASNLRLWARWVSVDGAYSVPTGGTNGIAALTGLVDDFQIANLSVAKLLAGSLSVGQYIQSADYVANTSGWRIQTLGGGTAFMEVNGGAIIGGATIGATFIQSNNYVLNTAGWRFNSNGTGQIGAFAVTNDGVQSTNYVLDTSGWKLKNDGTGQIGAFKVTNDGVQSTNYVLNTSGWRLKNDGTGQIGAFVVGNNFIRSTNYVAGSTGWNIPNGAGSVQFSDILLTGGLIRNSADTTRMDLGASGTSIVFRSGPLTNYGPYAGNHYPVEINADGSAFFGRGAVSGGTLKASGTAYAIPDKDRPAVLFQTTVDFAFGGT